VLTQVIRYPDITHAALATHEAAFEEAVRFFQCRFQARQPNRPE
ncbi:TPA: alpha/beta hydrolase, partial [Burkholderia cenocepacia]